MKNVKNLLIFVFCLFASINMYAQNQPSRAAAQDIVIPAWNTNVTPQTCFCCEGFYSLPAIIITGPTSLNCGDKPTYCIKPCPGANITWTVSAPNSIASGQGKNCITLNPTMGTSVTISVVISCGNKKVENKIIVPIKQIENCRADFLITLQELQNGMYQVHGYQTPPVPGTMHYWFLQEVANCPSGSQVSGGLNLGAYIAPNGAVSYSNPTSGMTPGSTNWGFQFSGLVKGKCYRLYHYTYCCGQWKMSYKCFCLASVGRMAIDLKALNENAVTKDVNVEELPADLRNRINQR